MRISKKRIYAADGDFDEPFMDEEYDESVTDNLDDMQDSIEDMQESIEDIQEDDVSIEADNNIANHYIAECDMCKGIFISAVTESDQEIEKISGTCPLCNKHSDQYLKWIVKEID